MKLLEGKNAIITGGSRGIGKGIAEVFAKHGANVAFTYNSSSQSAEELAKELEGLGIKAKAYQSNAASFKEAQELAKTIDKQIIDSFYLHPGNYIAGGCTEAVINKNDAAQFAERLAKVPEELRPLVLAMYAKPYHRKTQVDEQSCEH